MFFNGITKPNPLAVTSQLLRHLKIRFSTGGLQQLLEKHPHYPSLLAISDTLEEWHIYTHAMKISKDRYDATAFEYPFVAHLSADGGQFMLIQRIADGQVHYSNEKHTHAIMKETEFLRIWSGVILYAEAGEDSGEPSYRTGQLRDLLTRMRIPLLLFTILTALLAGIPYSSISTGYGLLLALKAVGVAVCVLLLMHSTDSGNPFIQNLCSLGRKNNCNAILRSEGSSITGWLSWSEIGFFYFAGTLLAMLMAPASMPLLSWLTILALPYTIYSVTYQYRHKNWCVLCCTVQVILWAEAACLWLSHKVASVAEIAAIPFRDYCMFCLALLLPVAGWAFIKPFLSRVVQFRPLQQQLNRIKFNSQLFNQVLKQQPCYAVPDKLMPLQIGNPAAQTVITMVSNPFCGPCGTAHHTLNTWLKTRDDLLLKIVFATSGDDNDHRTKVARHFSALAALNDPLLVEKALHDWYTQGSKNYEDWAAQYPVHINGELKDITENQKAWCNMADIRFTPTILINGYKLPEPYKPEDIRYLIA